MYVCNCNGIRERELTQGIQAGLTTVKALRETLGVGNCCGKCVCDVRRHLQAAQGDSACDGACHGHGHHRNAAFDVPLQPALC